MHNQRFDYLLENFRSAREEILFRVQHRDNWLKLQLLSQTALFALSQGIKLGGVEATGPIPYIASLSIPIAFIFTSLYLIEDSIIGYLSRYISKIASEETKLSKAKEPIYTWDRSEELQLYAKHALPLRVIYQFVGFVFVPLGLALPLLLQLINQTRSAIINLGIVGNILLWFITIFLLFRAYYLRRTTGQSFAGDRT